MDNVKFREISKMNLHGMARVVSEWAERKRQIKKVQFFGSRVRGTNTSNSDLDIAIELMPDLDESDGLATWIHNKREWEKELNRLLPVQVHLEWYSGENTRTIYKALDEASYQVFERRV